MSRRNPSHQPDLTVQGAGFAGLWTAHIAALRGYQVELVDSAPGHPAASVGAAGILAPLMEQPSRELLEAARAFPEALRRVGIDPAEIDYRPTGSIRLVEGEIRAADAAWERQVSLLDPSLLAAAPADLRLNERILPHVRILPHASVDASHLFGLLKRNLQSQDIEVVSPDWPHRGRAHVHALGASAEGSYPVRGSLVVYKPSPVRLESFVHLGLNYALSRSDGRLVVGGTVRPYDTNRGVPAADIRNLRRWAEKVFPSLKSVELLQAWNGHRPYHPKGLTVTRHDLSGVPTVSIQGLGRHGVMLAPVAASRALDLLGLT